MAHTAGMGIQDDLQRPVLVLGGTGGQGGAVAVALIQADRPVRALVRDPSSAGAVKLAGAGAQLAVAEFTDREALTAAMRGVAAAFAPTTPFESGPGAEVEQGQAIIDAAAAARLPHLVFSSVADATAGTGIPHFESKATVERALAASGPAAYGGGAQLLLRQRPRRLPGPARRASRTSPCPRITGCSSWTAATWAHSSRSSWPIPGRSPAAGSSWPATRRRRSR